MKGKIIKFSFAAFIFAVVLVINILCLTVFDTVLSRHLGGIYATIGSVGNLDTDYYKADYKNKSELNAAQKEFAERAVGEGVVLLKNDRQGGLSYADNTVFSLFSHSSVDLIYGGTGSGSGTEGSGLTSASLTMKKTFEERGLKVNDTLWNFYADGNGKGYVRGEGSKGYGNSEDYRINECPIDKIISDKEVAASFKNTVGVFVLSRVSGEGRDLPRSMVRHATSAADKVKSFLEPDSTELGVIDYVNANFDDVILIVNCNNPIELGWVDDYENIHTVLQMPGMGADGLYALPEILKGNVSPSGRLVDTFAYDAFSSPASENCDEVFCFVNGEHPKAAGKEGFYYMVYEEGIYVGYRYYETRYEDAVLGRGKAGDYDYSDTVQFPFGYGLSDTTFEWSDFKAEWNEAQTECKVSVTVKNTGGKKGKDVVEIYAQSPYIAGGVEKSAVELVGFAKTKCLEPQNAETVTVTFDKSQLKSYDYKTAKTYIMDAGDYYITAAKDAHAAINNILAKKDPACKDKLVPSPSEKVAGDATLVATTDFGLTETDKTTYAKEGDTEVVNKLDIGHLDGTTYLSRNNWLGTYPTPYGSVSDIESTYGNRVNGGSADAPGSFVYVTDITTEQYDAIYRTDPRNPVPDASFTKATTYGAKNGLELIEMRGANYDDPKWELLLDQLTKTETANIINLAGYGTIKVGSISKGEEIHNDGPSGFKGGYTFMCSVLMAQTWNTELAAEKGSLIGNESLLADKKYSGWYGPAMNTHRTPFSGRNFEYYSEDGFIGGVFGAAEVRAAAEKGLNAYIKHFAFNDSENHRGDNAAENGMNDEGICTWLNEQAAREIYLKPFELTVKSGTVDMRYYKDDDGKMSEATRKVSACAAMMTSFNRVGPVWAGGYYNLITGILREEWGFAGYIVTDMDHGNHMDTKQMLKAGADAKLCQITAKTDYNGKVYSLMGSASNADCYYAREAVHRLLYASVNSNASNGLVKGVTRSLFGYYKFILIAIDVVASAGIAVLIFFALRHRKNDCND